MLSWGFLVKLGMFILLFSYLSCIKLSLFIKNPAISLYGGHHPGFEPLATLLNVVTGHGGTLLLHGGLEGTNIAVGIGAGLGGYMLPDTVIEGIQVRR